jgi:hypothetical protein
MNKQYAIEILEMIERGTADRNYSLSKEAINYLQRLKSTAKDNDLMRRIESVKYGHRAK